VIDDTIDLCLSDQLHANREHKYSENKCENIKQNSQMMQKGGLENCRNENETS
jgi:hypothetical protein